MSRAIADPAGGMLDEVERRLDSFLTALPDEGALLSVSVEARALVEGVVAVLRELKGRRDSLLRYQRQVAEMRARLQEEVEESAYRALWDAEASVMRLRLQERQDRIALEEERMLGEYRRAVFEMKERVLELFDRLLKVSGRVGQLTGVSRELPSLVELFAFLDAPEPYEVWIAHEPRRRTGPGPGVRLP